MGRAQCPAFPGGGMMPENYEFVGCCSDCGVELLFWDEDAGPEPAGHEDPGAYLGDAEFVCWGCLGQRSRLEQYQADQVAEAVRRAAECRYCGAVLRPGRPHCRKGLRQYGELAGGG